jgi:hypothetical protein
MLTLLSLERFLQVLNESLLSLRGKKIPHETKKDSSQTPGQRVNPRGISTSYLSFEIDNSLLYFLTESAPTQS